jgi:hypothetical protein
MFDGVFPEVPKAQTGIFRKMRLDSNNKKIPCPCTDKFGSEPDKNTWCPICFGEGWYWDETYIQFYRVLQGAETENSLRDDLITPGLINVPVVVFYTRYDVLITEEDKIVEIKLDLEGDPIEPVKRKGIYRINAAWDYRSDNGKLEYWKIYTHLEAVKYLNAPSFESV